MKNACPWPKVAYSHCLFYPTISPTPKDIQFTIIEDKEKLQILKLGRWNQQMFATFLETN